MKKIITLVIIMMTLCITTIAQNFDYKYVLDIPDYHGYDYCQGIDGIIITKDTTCTYVSWGVFDYYGQTILEGNFYQITITPEMGEFVGVTYDGCGIGKSFWFNFLSSDPIPEPWAENCRWKDKGETIMLTAYAPNTTSQWSTGQTGPDIYVTNPGLYGVHMFNQCSEVWDSIWVLDKEELQTVSVDPYTDHIMISWEVNPYLATYLQSIQLYRDGYFIATVPYTDGEYTDEAVYGSVTSRTYTCKSVSTEGYVSPFGSQKPSMHMVYLVDMFNNIVMEVNDVSDSYPIVQYYISLWEDGNITHIDSVAVREGKIIDKNTRFTFTRDGIIRYTAPEWYFSQGGFLIVEADMGERKRDRIKLLSNRGSETVGLTETKKTNFEIYPNPAIGRVTIEGTGSLSITNTLGQTVLTKEIDGQTTIELPQGLYFVKLGGITRKIVVE